MTLLPTSSVHSWLMYW